MAPSAVAFAGHDVVTSAHPVIDDFHTAGEERSLLGEGKRDVHHAAVDALRRTTVFSTLDEEALQRLACPARRRQFGKGAIVAEIEGEGHDPIVPVRGSLRLFRSCSAGQEVTLATFGAGDVFGLVYGGSPVWPHGTLEATTCLDAYVIPRSTFCAVLAARPALAHTVLGLLGERLTTLCDRVEELALYNVLSRLAHELVRQADDGGGHWVEATHEQLAALIGSTQPHVTRSIGMLRDEGLIEVRPRRSGIRVLDRPGLGEYGKDRA